MKSFSAARDNQIRITFPNGNTLSTVWGFGSYSDNHFPDLEVWDMTKGAEFSKLGLFFPYKESDTAEVMCEVDPETEKRILERFPDYENPILPYLSLDQWLDLLQIVRNKEKE